MVRVYALMLAMVAAVTALATEPTTQKALPYSDRADAQRDIDEASARAKEKNQRVLLDIGANWCGWCLRMHELFTDNAKVSGILKESYQVVYVDVGHGEKNRDILAFYNLTVKAYPHLVVLDPEGNVLTQQDTGVFETSAAHNPEKVAAFLEKWKAPAAGR